MVKMERALNPRLEKETIYEIYRACRLCGAGAGYKMPIMQNVVDLEDTELKLSQKIRECVQIEVHPDDKMPPLICELCVDKVNDFYEFLELCRQTNKQTRLKLGLPIQTTPRGVFDSGDCILGDTGPVYNNEDSDVEPLSNKTKVKPKNKENGKVKVKKEPGVKIKTEKVNKEDRSRACRMPVARPATPPAPLRVTRTSSAASNDLNTRPLEPPKKSKPPIKSIMKKEKEDVQIKVEVDNLSKYKRLRSDKDVKPDVPIKKVKISIESPPKSKKASPKSKPKPAKRPASPARRPASPAKRPASPARPPAKQTGTKRKPSPARPVKRNASPRRGRSPARRPAPPARPARHPVPPAPPARPASPAGFTCEICFITIRNTVGYHNHLRCHTVTFTKPTLACNACGEWFLNTEEASAHHKRHKFEDIPYKCRRCTAEYKLQIDYEDHFGKSQCIPYDEVPDVKCEDCLRYFATDRLLIEHKCAGEEGRPGGKCMKCNRTYVLLKNLKRHESTCMHRKRSDVIADPEVLDRLKPVEIRMARCDPLLENKRQGHYNVSNVRNFGFDRNCVYPYKTIKIKSEPFLGMVIIHDEVKQELCSKEYVHWDSTDNEEEVSSLSALSLKTIYSQKFLGRVPKKRRVKDELEKLADIDANSGRTVDSSSDGTSVYNISNSVTDDSVGKKGSHNVEKLNCESNSVTDIVQNETSTQKVNNLDSTTGQVKSIGGSETEVTKKRDQELKLSVNVDSIRLDTLSINENKNMDRQNGDTNEKSEDIDDFGNDSEDFNGNENTNESFDDIDSTKIIEALNAHIGEDNEPIDGKIGENPNLEGKEADQSRFNNSSNENHDNISNNGESHRDEKQPDTINNDEKSSNGNHNKGENYFKSTYNENPNENSETDHIDYNNQQDSKNSQKIYEEQNGERNGLNDGQIENGKVDKDKFSLEDLLSKDSEKNMELENISDDDFNFDV